MSWSHYHTSVTSDDMVIVIVTNYKAIEKNVKGSERMTSYNVYNTCWP